MIRVHIFGASGSGVTTLGKRLGETIGLPVFDGDTYYWEKTDPPFLKPTAIPERQKALLQDLSPHPSWVCSGSMDSWSEPFENLFTHILFLYVPHEVRQQRLREREGSLFGQRIAPGGDMHFEHEKFIDWAGCYDAGTRNGRSLPRHKIWLERQKAPILKIEGVRTPEESLSQALRFVRS
jgi:adenylate kinase family enzyme